MKWAGAWSDARPVARTYVGGPNMSQISNNHPEVIDGYPPDPHTPPEPDWRGAEYEHWLDSIEAQAPLRTAARRARCRPVRAAVPRRVTLLSDGTGKRRSPS